MCTDIFDFHSAKIPLFLSANQVFGLFVQAGDGTGSLTDVHVFLILLNVTD